MDTTNQIDALSALTDILGPFKSFALEPLERRRALTALGWDADALDNNFLVQIASTLSSLYDGICDLVANPPKSLEDIGRVLSLLATAIQGIRSVAAAANQTFSLPPELATVGLDLLELYLLEFLKKQHPLIYRSCVLLTLVRDSEDLDPVLASAVASADGHLLRVPRPISKLQFSNLAALLQDPVGHLKTEYFPGGLATDADAYLAADRLFPRVAALLDDINGLVVVYGVRPELLQPGDWGPGQEMVKHMLTFFTDPTALTTVSDHGTVTQLDFGASMFLTSKQNPAVGAALVVAPFGSFKVDVPIGQWDLKLGLEAAPGGFAIGERGFQVLINSETLQIKGELEVGKSTSPEGNPAWALGAAKGTRLQISGVSLNLAVDYAGGDVDVGFLFKLDKSALVISPGDGDGFLQKVLPKDGFKVDFDLAFGWSRKKGVYFDGGAGFEVTLPVNLSLAGIVKIDSVSLGLAVGKEGLKLGAGLSAGVNIGPVAASIEKMGIQFKLAFHDGNLGPVDLSVGFKPPTGIGIVVEAGPVVGGGYISFDPDNGRYAGVLQLSLYAISITAIALLDTKLPGGNSGFSFLIIIAVEFTPIQLGFGFTLNGIGGLAGINRTIMTEPLREGLRSHSLDNILFPKNPVKRATQLISDLRAIFPPAEGRYVFGPMIKIGWGTFVEAELGVILELPSPIKLIILGQLNAIFPDKAAPIVELHLDVLGILDFGKKEFSLDASLHDSRVAVFNISGDMALRMSWGDDPNFAMSLGGLNPHFQPPANFPKLRRLCISLGDGDNPRLSLEAYFALTSNSFQFGAALSLYVALGPVSIKGFLGFDALFIFNPFSFIIELEVLLEVKFGSLTLIGIHLKGMLSGPTPWHIVGEASLTVLFFEIAVHVDVTFGEEHKETLPEADPWPLLNAAISDARNWSASLAPSALQVVTLSAPEGASAPLLVDPMGGATLREKVVPLNRAFTKFGEARPSGPGRYDLTGVKVGSQMAATTLVQDHFAPAQFRDMTDAEKVQSPSFIDMPAGFSLASDAVMQDGGISLVVDYDTRVVTSKEGSAAGANYQLSLAQQLNLANSSGAAAAAPLRVSGQSKYAAPNTASPVSLLDELYVITSKATLQVRPDISEAAPYGQAQEALAAYLRLHPSERGQLQLVVLTDMEEAA